MFGLLIGKRGDPDDATESSSSKPPEKWTKCRDSHLAALPPDLKDKIDPSDVARLNKFEALILELLPKRKRRDVEAAIRAGILKIRRIENTNLNIVFERKMDTLYGLVTGSPMVRIKDFFKNGIMD